MSDELSSGEEDLGASDGLKGGFYSQVAHSHQ